MTPETADQPLFPTQTQTQSVQPGSSVQYEEMAGQIPQEKNADRLTRSGILANWNWTQPEWDSLAKVLGNKQFSWKTSLRQALVPIIFIAALNVPRLFIGSSPSSGRLPLTYYLPYFSVLGVMGILGLTAYQWFHKSYFPSPKAGEKPQIILGKEGVMMGRRFFFWEPPAMKIENIGLLPSQTSSVYSLRLDIRWTFGVGQVVIPVPNDKLAEAQQAVTAITELSKNQPYGSMLK